ncbi:MAG TPA: phosphatidate cytidylyltransferase [Syntrophomonadaceae bacterium]|nr:phosphatidate cytidylyltransferase [Syntrophomonadaceae bacterium]
MLKKRIITILIGIPFILAILYIGGICWTLFFTVLGLGSLYEFNRMTKKSYQPPLFIGVILFLITMFYMYNYYLLLTIVLFIVGLVIYLIARFPRETIIDISLILFPALYIGISLSFAILINNQPDGFVLMLAVFLLTWSSDVGGYIFGKKWGKRKLAPALSPNKTWEGSLGGVILTIITAFVFLSICDLGNYSLYSIILLGFAASIAAQLGDLLMSGVKRVFDVEDSGNIIPGHGGILDRFDSFLLVLPVVYCFLYYGQFL